MKRNYYCLISGLPELKWDDRKPSLGIVSFREMLIPEIHPSDMRLVSMLYLPYDHSNILNRLYKKDVAFDLRGNYDSAQIDRLCTHLVYDDGEKIETEKYIDSFLNLFFEADEKPSRVQAEKELTTGWLELIRKSGNKFLAYYSDFELLTRNIFTAMLGQKYNTPVADILVGES